VDVGRGGGLWMRGWGGGWCEVGGGGGGGGALGDEQGAVGVWGWNVVVVVRVGGVNRAGAASQRLGKGKKGLGGRGGGK